MQVNIYEAKTNLSKLLEIVKEGEEVILAKSGTPIAKIIPFYDTKERPFGTHKGEFIVAEDFDEYDPDIATMFGMGGEK